MNIRELIEKLEKISSEYGEDCYAEGCSNELTIYEVRGQVIEIIDL